MVCEPGFKLYGSGATNERAVEVYDLKFSENILTPLIGTINKFYNPLFIRKDSVFNYLNEKFLENMNIFIYSN